MIWILLLTVGCYCGEPIGLAVVPHLTGGDQTEQLIYHHVKQLDEIDEIIAPGNAAVLFDRLNAMSQAGTRLKYLIVAGHGSRETPSIKLSSGLIMPNDVDVLSLCRQWQRDRAAIKRNEANGVNNVALTMLFDETTAKLNRLTGLSNIMAKDAKVVLLNCSTYATPNGQNFVSNFGRALLGLRGGTIRTSKNDIKIGDPETFLQIITRQLTGASRELSGPIPVTGDWEVIPIAGSGRLDTKPHCPPPRVTAQNLFLHETHYKVYDFDKKGFVKGQLGKSHISKWRIDAGSFHYQSDEDGTIVEVYWDAMATMLAPLEPFVFSVHATRFGTRKVEVTITPLMNIDRWRLNLKEHNNAQRVGINAFRIEVPESERSREGFLELGIEAIGRGGDILDGEVVGGNGRMYLGKKPGEFDVFFLELNCQGLAKIRWTFVPRDSPHR